MIWRPWALTWSATAAPPASATPGPSLAEQVEAINEGDLVACSVLSGNRNFEGRISPHVRANYLASPPLVVAYALAGHMNVDLYSEPLGKGSDGSDVFLKDIWPTPQEVQDVVREALGADMFAQQYASVFDGDESWQKLAHPARASCMPGTRPAPTYGTRRTSRAWAKTSPCWPTSAALACWPSSATR